MTPHTPTTLLDQAKSQTTQVYEDLVRQINAMMVTQKMPRPNQKIDLAVNFNILVVTNEMWPVLRTRLIAGYLKAGWLVVDQGNPVEFHIKER